MAEALCGVCNTDPKKYKCPTCALPYCSLSCFKAHKPSHDNDATNPAPTAPESSLAQLQLPSPPPPAPRYLRKKTDFSILATNPKFQDLLKTYPALLPTLQRVYAATIEPEPQDEAPRRAFTRGGFRGRGTRGRGRGRGRGGDFGAQEGRPSIWTQKKGDAHATRLLKGLRDGRHGDKEKDAIAAFVQLAEETFNTHGDISGGG
ncbi:hypothetical protein GQ44DRAFT_606927 [Phaeosphaeriaceae sp. PMI808]|nr:hypothetical protein GQ44DRAFT_606927 [Phaeosphaeriaceae sp. PMI808]